MHPKTKEKLKLHENWRVTADFSASIIFEVKDSVISKIKISDL
jgi:hypothetical protein